MHTPSLHLLFSRPEGTTPAKTENNGRPLGDFQIPAKGDPNVLIGNRWLSRGDIGILASTSGMGKSSLSIQAATTWGLGRKLFGGFAPHRPLKSLIIQAEDGDGDIAEVKESMYYAMKLTPEERAQVNQNVIIVTDRVHRGLTFRTELQRLLVIHKPDIVFINPLLAFIGGDVNDSSDVGTFLREQLNSLNDPIPNFAYIIVHHTAKPPKEKSERKWNEVMYEMAGSADLTNASRAILALQATETAGEFVLKAAKRGARAGLTKIEKSSSSGIPVEVSTTEVSIRHSKDRMMVDGQDLGVIHWERFDPAPKASTSRGGRPSDYSIEQFFAHIPASEEKALPQQAIFKYVERMSPISRTGFKTLIFRAAEDGVIRMVDKPGIGAVFFRRAE